jgi:hypothetical protein
MNDYAAKPIQPLLQFDAIQRWTQAANAASRRVTPAQSTAAD